MGFTQAPRFLGVDEEGREVLSFIDGESGGAGWRQVASIDGLRAMISLLEDYQQAVRGFHLHGPTAWSAGVVDLDGSQVICHGDFGPWNVVWRDGQAVGLLDWDHARPGDALDDVGYAAQYLVPLRSDEDCVSLFGYDEPPDRRTRLRVLSDGFTTTPDAVLRRAVEMQLGTIALVESLADRGLEPQATWVREGLLDDLAGRLAWAQTNGDSFV
ncbi:MAG TPA: phosphotransferase [Actinomycetota bacterium]|nr:phosphotransferase [Actinomycetota bacterium]